MPSFKRSLAAAVPSARSNFTLFDIRLDNDFLVFRGTEHESSGQYLRGVVAVCLTASTKVEDIHLRLTGTLRHSWADSKTSSMGPKMDKSTVIMNHRWPAFWTGAEHGGILEQGNYEFPFELQLDGSTAESVEGLSEASITYKLKATVARGKLGFDLHAYKHVRVVRTLESSALEFLHAMSVENIWPNKIEYSIVVPQKAIVFGSAVPIEARFTPLLKGLELGDVTVRLIESREFVAHGSSLHGLKEYKKEQEAKTWVLNVTREEHWQDMIEDTGQEGWVLKTELDLPKKLGACIQDVNAHGIKIRHKLKMIISLKNPDGHISELRATLPLSLFISPNIPLDEEGNLTRPTAAASGGNDRNGLAPPGYGEHVLDQLYEDVDVHGTETPAPESMFNSPIYGQSRSASSENLAGMLGESAAVPPAALASRLQNVSAGTPSLSSSPRSNFLSSSLPSSHHIHGLGSSENTPPTSAPLSRQNSDEGSATPEMWELCKVPSYATAIKTRPCPLDAAEGMSLPTYSAVVSAPATPTLARTPLVDPLANIPENSETSQSGSSSPRPRMGRRRQTASGFTSLWPTNGDNDERRRLHLMQVRERVA